jgi:hypothetical protein
MSTLYNRQTAIDHDFYHFDIISADIYSFLCLCLQVQNKKVIVSKVISGVWLQHHHNVSQTINLPTHWKNFQLYLKLYHQSRKNGKWWLYSTIWLAKAGYNYSKSYFSGIFRSLQHKIAKG